MGRAGEVLLRRWKTTYPSQGTRHPLSAGHGLAATVSQLRQKEESRVDGKEHSGSVRQGQTEGLMPGAVTQISPVPSEGVPLGLAGKAKRRPCELLQVVWRATGKEDTGPVTGPALCHGRVSRMCGKDRTRALSPVLPLPPRLSLGCLTQPRVCRELA